MTDQVQWRKEEKTVKCNIASKPLVAALTAARSLKALESRLWRHSNQKHLRTNMYRESQNNNSGIISNY